MGPQPAGEAARADGGLGRLPGRTPAAAPEAARPSRIARLQSGVTERWGGAGVCRLPAHEGRRSRAMAQRGVGGVLRGPYDPALLQRPPVLCYNSAAAFNVA